MPSASDPRLLARLARLELRARTAVEGLAGGRHASPLRGASSTFAEHREYVPGDDLRHLDWRVMARTERDIVREFEEETDLTAWLVLDASASMRFASLEWSKWEYATWLAGALAWLLVRQNDNSGLVAVAGTDILRHLPPRSGERHRRQLLELLAALEPTGDGEPGAGLEEAAALLDRRGLVVWISDCLGEVDHAVRAAARLRRAGHDLVVLRVLDPREIDFAFDRTTRFDPLETGERLVVEPRAIREAYRQEYEAHASELRRRLRALGADFRLLATDGPLEAGLVEFLARRAARLRRRGR